MSIAMWVFSHSCRLVFPFFSPFLIFFLFCSFPVFYLNMLANNLYVFVYVFLCMFVPVSLSFCNLLFLSHPLLTPSAPPLLPSVPPTAWVSSLALRSGGFPSTQRHAHTHTLTQHRRNVTRCSEETRKHTHIYTTCSSARCLPSPALNTTANGAGRRHR